MQGAKKLARNGNSLSFVIEKPILDVLGIDKETYVQKAIKEIDGQQCLVLRAVNPEERQRIVREMAEKVMKTQEPVLKKLAE